MYILTKNVFSSTNSTIVHYLSDRLMDPINRHVGRKLGVATGCMFTLPIIAFFIAQYIFQHKRHPDNWAAGAAILVTNLVIAGYCVSAFTEEDDTKLEKNKNDDDGPRVGIFKQRTD
jgi:VMA21-like domain